MREDLNVAETRLNRLLDLILETAVDVLGFDAATMSVRHVDADGQHLATICATDQRLVALDDAQYETGAGPCLTVLDPHEPILVEDIADQPAPWEYFALTAAHLGIVSSLSVHVPTEDVPGVSASLNFYARQRHQMSAQQLRTATGYAEQLAAAFIGVEAYTAAANLAQQMAEAMQSRAVIEQAKGILIARDGITADQA